MKDWSLARRELLKALGVGAACLPILRASKSYAQPSAFPKRFVAVLLTEGYRPGQVAPNPGPLANQTLEQWATLWRVNLAAPFIDPSGAAVRAVLDRARRAAGAGGSRCARHAVGARGSG